MKVVRIQGPLLDAGEGELCAVLDELLDEGDGAVSLRGRSLLSLRHLPACIDYLRKRGIRHVELVTSMEPGEELRAEDWNGCGVERIVLDLESTARAMHNGRAASDLLELMDSRGTGIVLKCWLARRLIGELEGWCRDVARVVRRPSELRLGLDPADDGLGIPDIREAIALSASCFDGRVPVRTVRGGGIPVCSLPLRAVVPLLDHHPGADGCDGCSLRLRCDGVPVARRATMLEQVRPFRSIPASVLGPRDRIDDLSPGVRVGRYNRLKQHGTLEGFLSRSEEWPPDVPVLVTERDARRLDVDLTGLDVVIARMPVAVPLPDFEPLRLAPMAPVVLATMLRGRGARVDIVDLAVRCRRDLSYDELEMLGDGEGWIRCLEAGPSPEQEELLGAIASMLPQGPLGLLALSAEGRTDVPLAMALGRHVAGARGASVVVGGRVLEGLERLAPLWSGCLFVLGEGEVPLVMLADALLRSRPLDRVPALAWMEDGRLRRTRGVLHDLDVMPTLDISGMPLRGYHLRYVDLGDDPVLPYIFNKGCPWICGYCGDHTRRIVRFRSPSRIVDDLAAATGHGVDRFFFINHLFNADRRHMMELLGRLEERGLDIEWADSCKALGLDRETLSRIRAVGGSVICWGLDVGSRRLARIMRKGIDLDQAAAILRDAHEVGISNHVNLVVGMPHETGADVEETIRYVERIRPSVSRFHVGRYHYYPHSLLGLHPGHYGLERGGSGGVDVPGGRTWEEHEATMEEHVGRVMDAAYGCRVVTP